ncbi:hypothetical protein OCL06_07885 [Alteromonas sp. ASW11-19]|uniref:Uncharacterized protein n=1 Tax=Alteromonas salexigens TaxID=2982530 RepID=A0ABT2VQJ3_9ALTE|nr:hypothetical protein [Alteromonas salexigens]MCU7554516.1 hypothetical protein [Alteromonas salexigens]
MNKQATLSELTDMDPQHVSGGQIPFPLPGAPTMPLQPVTPPVYITLAIGEGGGDLPDMLS